MADETEPVAGGAVELSAGELAQADFGSGQVGQDGHRLAELGCHTADGGQTCLVFPAIAVGHVHTKHVDAGGDQLGQLVGFGTGRPDGGHDLRLRRSWGAGGLGDGHRAPRGLGGPLSRA